MSEPVIMVPFRLAGVDDDATPLDVWVPDEVALTSSSDLTTLAEIEKHTVPEKATVEWNGEQREATVYVAVPFAGATPYGYVREGDLS